MQEYQEYQVELVYKDGPLPFYSFRTLHFALQVMEDFMTDPVFAKAERVDLFGDGWPLLRGFISKVTLPNLPAANDG